MPEANGVPIRLVHENLFPVLVGDCGVWNSMCLTP